MLNNIFLYATFNGARLKSARKYRGKIIVELADNIEISKQAISQYENGIIYPVKDIINVKLGNTYFRASSKLSKKEESIQKEKSELIGKIFNILCEYIDFPKLNLTEIDPELPIEEKAMNVREHWGLGEEPIKDIIYVLEKNGIVITAMNTDTENVDAYSQRQDINGKTHYVIVLGNDKCSDTRRQFSVAHELGHIIMHDAFLDLEDLTKEEQRNIENEAHEFASAFLLPRNTFSRDASVYPTNLNYYKQLKKKWRTSISAMLVRANNLSIISYNDYQTLIRKMEKSG